MKVCGIGFFMHIKIKNKTAIIYFETDQRYANHIAIIDEMVHLVQHRFKTFVFDFSGLEIGFNSTVSGFLLGVVRKLLECGCDIVIQNISNTDREVLELIGIKEIDGKISIKSL